MWDHVEKCWGEKVMKIGKEAGTKEAAVTAVINPTLQNNRLTFYFDKQVAGGAVTFSTTPHSREETR